MGIAAKNPNETNETNTSVAGEVEGPLLRDVDHIAIVVEDLDDAIAEHRELYGVLVDHRDELHGEDAEVAFLAVGGSTTMLISPMGEGSEYAEFLAEGGPGLHHVGYRVADITVALATLVQAGATLVDDEPVPGPRNSKTAFVHPDSASGVLIQLVER